MHFLHSSVPVVFLLLVVAISAYKLREGPPRFPHVSDPIADLKALGDRIANTSVLSAATIGDLKLWNYLEKGLVAGDNETVGSFPIKNLKINLISRKGVWNLEVSGSADLWGKGAVPFQVVFFYTNSTLDFFVSFGVQLSALPTSLVPKDTSTNPHVTEWYNGLNISSLVTIGIGSTTFTDLSGNTFQRGITISVTITTNSNLPLSHQLHQLMYGPSSNSTITGSLVAYFPLDSNDPLATFTLTLDGGINFGSPAVKSSNLVLQLVVSTNPNVKISTTIWVAVGNQTLQFTIFADLGLVTGFEFKGSLNSPWKAPLGLQWLTFTNVDLDFKLNPLGAIGSLTFDMDATLTFSGAPPVQTTFDFDLTPTGEPSILFTIETSIAGVDILFDKVIGVRPPNVDQITVQGSTTLAIATAPKQGYETGLTIKGNAILAGKGPLVDAGRAISSYSQKPLQFTFFLYTPIFSTNPEDINFQLSEITPVQIGDGAIMDTATFQLIIHPNPIVTLSSKLTLSIENSPTNFDLTAVIQEGSLAFTGKQEGEWDNAFGFVWLKISDATLHLIYNTTSDQITQLSLEGNINITFATPNFPTVSVYFSDGFKQWAFSITCKIPNLAQFSNEVLKRNDAPPPADEIGVDASLTVSNFAYNNVIAGVTLVGTCTISGNGKIAEVFHGLKGNFVQTFSLNLAIPIWSSTMPTLQVGYSEQGGEIALSSNIVLNGLGLVVRLLPDPMVSVTSQGTITLSRNAALTFNVWGEIGGTQGFTINGQLQGTWTQPFGINWLMMTNVDLNIGFNSGFLVNQLSFSANPTFTFQKQSIILQATIQTASNLQDFAFLCNNIPINSVPDVVQHTYGSVPPEVLSLNAVQGTIDLVLANYAGTTSQGLAFTSGLTLLMQEVTLSNSLLGELAVFHAGSLQLWSSLTIPIWGGSNIAIALSTNEVIVFSSQASMSGISFGIQTAPPSIDAHSAIKLNLKNNDPLTFTLDGSVSVTGGVMLTGAMQGVWNNVFGVHGFDISNAVVKIGLAPQYCPLCIDDLGIGFTMPMGQTTVIFYANIDLANLWDVFVNAQLPSISFQQIAMGYNHMVGTSLPHINPATIPSNWGFTAVKFYLAPTAGTFGGITYQAGFFLQGGILLFGIEAYSNIQITSNDFVFQLSLDKASIQNSINSHLKVALENHEYRQRLNLTKTQLQEIIQAPMSVVEVTLSDLQGMSLQNIASGRMPDFVIEYKFLGKYGHASFGVLLSDLWSDFDSFFSKFLKKLFHIL